MRETFLFIWSREGEWARRFRLAFVPAMLCRLSRCLKAARQRVDPYPPLPCSTPWAPVAVSRARKTQSCVVVSGSGDNPCGLAGLGLSEEGTVAVSLGTSDTIMGITREPRPQQEVCLLYLDHVVVVVVALKQNSASM